jgi:hypothetical protein
MDADAAEQPGYAVPDVRAPHRTNRFGPDSIANPADVRWDRTPIKIDRHGDTLGASIRWRLIADLADLLKSEPAPLMTAGLGVASFWGGADISTARFGCAEALIL